MTMVDHITLVPMDVPNPGGGAAPPGFSNFTTIMSWGKWISLGNRRGEGGEHASAIGWVLGGATIVSAAFTIVATLAN